MTEEVLATFAPDELWVTPWVVHDTAMREMMAIARLLAGDPVAAAEDVGYSGA